MLAYVGNCVVLHYDAVHMAFLLVILAPYKQLIDEPMSLLDVVHEIGLPLHGVASPPGAGIVSRQRYIARATEKAPIADVHEKVDTGSLEFEVRKGCHGNAVEGRYGHRVVSRSCRFIGCLYLLSFQSISASASRCQNASLYSYVGLRTFVTESWTIPCIYLYAWFNS